MRYNVELQAQATLYTDVTIVALSQEDAEEKAQAYADNICDLPPFTVNLTSIEQWEVNGVALANEKAVA